jgi:hypothetical protein
MSEVLTILISVRLLKEPLKFITQMSSLQETKLSKMDSLILKQIVGTSTLILSPLMRKAPQEGYLLHGRKF